MRKAPVRLLIISGCTLPLCACGGVFKAPPAMTASFGTQPQSSEQDLSSLFYPEGTRTKLYTITDEIGGVPRGTERRVITPTNEQGTWMVRAARLDRRGNSGAERVTALQHDEQGRVVMLWVRTPEDLSPKARDSEARQFRFDPPLPMMPRTLAPGQREEYHAEMVELDPETGKEGSLKGAVTRSVYLLDDAQRARLFPDEPVGTQSPALVAIMEVRFGPVTDKRWIVAIADPSGTDGITMEHEEKSRTFMGLGGKARTERFTLEP